MNALKPLAKAAARTAFARATGAADNLNLRAAG